MIAFCNTYVNVFACSFLFSLCPGLAPEPSMRFNRQDFIMATEIYLAYRFRSCLHMSEQQSVLKVDFTRYVFISSAMVFVKKVVIISHNLVQRDTMKQVAISRVPVKGDNSFITIGRLGSYLKWGR